MNKLSVFCVSLLSTFVLFSGAKAMPVTVDLQSLYQKNGDIFQGISGRQVSENIKNLSNQMIATTEYGIFVDTQYASDGESFQICANGGFTQAPQTPQPFAKEKAPKQAPQTPKPTLKEENKQQKKPETPKPTLK